MAQNLDIHGRLFGLPRAVRQGRTRELLARFGLEDRAGDLVMRGLAQAKRTLILVDGIPFNDGYSSGVTWSSIPVDSIERIEVIRGPGSALYGGNAMTHGGLYQGLEELDQLLAQYEQAKIADKARAHALEHLICGAIRQSNLDKELHLDPTRNEHNQDFPSLVRGAHEALSRIRNTLIQDGMDFSFEVPKDVNYVYIGSLTYTITGDDFTITHLSSTDEYDQAQEAVNKIAGKKQIRLSRVALQTYDAKKSK